MDMFKQALKYTAGIVMLAVLISACSDELTSINENPNAPTDVPARVLLPKTIESTSTLISGETLLKSLTWYINQGTADVYAGNPFNGLFQTFRGASNDVWPRFYHNLENLRLIREMARDEESANKEAVATILMVYNYQIVTDLWGDVPYSDALKGNSEDEDEILTPSYDTQESIYEDLLTKLNNAVSMIDVSESGFGSSDVLYNGDMNKWLKFGNSLKLRLYLRIAEVNESMASQGIIDTYDEGNGMIFQSNSDNAEFEYGSYPYNHPINNDLRNRDDYRMSNTLIDTLKAFDDPRLRVYAIPTENFDDYRGAQNGVSASDNALRGDLSQLGAYFESPTLPGFLMTYAEVKFILAEAAARGWIQEDAETMYNEAVGASMKAFSEERIGPKLSELQGTRTYDFQKLEASDFPNGITESEINQYLAQSDVQYNQSEWRQKIGLQKWIALFGQGVQNWISTRRIGYPVIEMPDITTYDTFPTRLPYPTKEQSLNESNYDDAVSSQGPDDIVTKVWWDVDV